MKQVCYRDGLVTFEIPDNWIEDTEDETAGMFYEDVAEAGILQLSITTATNPNPVTTELLTAMLDSLTKSKTKALEILPNGNVALSYITPNREGEQLRVIFFWIIGNPVPPNQARIATFSYTTLAANAVGFSTQRTVAFLDKSIRNAVFSPQAAASLSEL